MRSAPHFSIHKELSTVRHRYRSARGYRSYLRNRRKFGRKLSASRRWGSSAKPMQQSKGWLTPERRKHVRDVKSLSKCFSANLHGYCAQALGIKDDT